MYSPRSGRVALAAVALSLVVAALAAALPASAAGPSLTPGSSGVGDPSFPFAGNGGYDVSHYALTLSWDPSSNRLSGTAVITASATQDLSSFDLDLRGFTISRLLVNGQPAANTRSGDQELVITPRSGLR